MTAIVRNAICPEFGRVRGGLSQDVPLLIPGWNGDRLYSLAIYRDGTWFLKPDVFSATIVTVQFGAIRLARGGLSRNPDGRVEREGAISPREASENAEISRRYPRREFTVSGYPYAARCLLGFQMILGEGDA